MKTLAPHLAFSTFFLLIISTFYPLESVAQSITNGYICSPKNIGGEETRLYFRQQEGVAENISKTATFPVVCPVVIEYDLPPYFVLVSVGHSSDSSQTIACSLEEYDINAVKVRGIGKSVNLAPGSGDFLSWEEIYLQNPTNYLSLRCILPPLGGIAEVAWF
jgi:hypothetical protein